MEELIQKIIDWAEERGILAHSTPEKQYLKFMSELGEFCDDLAKENYEAAKMELGDVIVTIILYFELKASRFKYIKTIPGSNINDVSFETCALAYNVIDLAKFQSSHGLLAFSILINSTPEECLQLAYDKISKRKTTIVNGVAVKE